MFRKVLVVKGYPEKIDAPGKGQMQLYKHFATVKEADEEEKRLYKEGKTTAQSRHVRDGKTTGYGVYVKKVK